MSQDIERRDPALAPVWDAIASMEAHRALDLLRPFGVPVGPVQGTHHAQYGTLVLANVDAADVYLRLPVPKLEMLGVAVATKKITAGANDIIAFTTAGVTIDGSASYTVSNARSIEVFILATPALWIRARLDS